MRWCPDVVVSQLDRAREAPQVARRLRVPWVMVVHNDHPVYRGLIETWHPALTVFNTHWIERKFGTLRGRRTMVVHPPVEPARHRTTPGELVTLVNVQPNKGSALFYALAQRMPATGFLAVEGGYGKQDLR